MILSRGKLRCCRPPAWRGISIGGGSESIRSSLRNGSVRRRTAPHGSRRAAGRHQLVTNAKPPVEDAARGALRESGPSLLGHVQQQAQETSRVAEVVRRAMVRPRAVPLLNTTTNLSNQCGHLSFVILALAYLETDVLALRGYAASGIGLSILFQYYRPQPLWIPIGWNGVFLLINASMIGLLLGERSEAAKIDDDPEQAEIFDHMFKRMELNPVDFVRLIDVAERRVVPKGTRLSQEGKIQEEIFLIVEGAAQVEADGEAVGHLEQKQFVGSMAFNRFIQASPAAAAPPHAQAAQVASEPPLRASPAGENASHTITITNSGGGHGGGHGDDAYIIDGYVPGGGGVFEEAKEVALNVLRRDSIVGNAAQAFVLDSDGNRRLGSGSGSGGDTGGLQRSGTTVTATTDMVVFAWDMYLLRAFIKRRPLARAAFMNAISADLTRKVDQSRGPEERYRLLLAEALDGGVVTPIEKRKLQRYRSMHGISPEEHRELLKLYTWSEEEFEAGFQKGIAPRDGSKHFLAYESLVRRELAKGEVQDKVRRNLRNFRAQAGIDAQEHLLALEKQGWTADDYEVGSKGKGNGPFAAGRADPAESDVGERVADIGTGGTDGKEHNSNSFIQMAAEVEKEEAEPPTRRSAAQAEGPEGETHHSPPNAEKIANAREGAREGGGVNADSREGTREGGGVNVREYTAEPPRHESPLRKARTKTAA